jgi:hypothetical protein
MSQGYLILTKSILSPTRKQPQNKLSNKTKVTATIQRLYSPHSLTIVTTIGSSAERCCCKYILDFKFLGVGVRLLPLLLTISASKKDHQQGLFTVFVLFRNSTLSQRHHGKLSVCRGRCCCTSILVGIVESRSSELASSYSSVARSAGASVSLCPLCGT